MGFMFIFALYNHNENITKKIAKKNKLPNITILQINPKIELQNLQTPQETKVRTKQTLDLRRSTKSTKIITLANMQPEKALLPKRDTRHPKKKKIKKSVSRTKKSSPKKEKKKNHRKIILKKRKKLHKNHPKLKLVRKTKTHKHHKKKKNTQALLNNFAKYIRNKIHSNAQSKPRIAQRRSLHGSVNLIFTITPDGGVANISATGLPLFTKSAKKALQKSLPFNTSNVQSSMPRQYNVVITYK